MYNTLVNTILITLVTCTAYPANAVEIAAIESDRAPTPTEQNNPANLQTKPASVRTEAQNPNAPDFSDRFKRVENSVNTIELQQPENRESDRLTIIEIR